MDSTLERVALSPLLCIKRLLSEVIAGRTMYIQALHRIETLLFKKQNSQLNPDEEQKLDRYEEIDDYLSFLNRVVRNLFQAQDEQTL
jgi:hypothetical protein